MAISDKTRKKLWAKSGNRCSICKTDLFSNKEKAEDLNIGEECHIISSKPKGPRHKISLGLIGSAILLFIFFRILPVKVRIPFVAVCVVGCLSGYYLWMYLLGSKILP